MSIYLNFEVGNSCREGYSADQLEREIRRIREIQQIRETQRIRDIQRTRESQLWRKITLRKAMHIQRDLA